MEIFQLSRCIQREQAARYRAWENSDLCMISKTEIPRRWEEVLEHGTAKSTYMKFLQAKLTAGDPEQESCALWQSAAVGEAGEYQQTH